MAKPKRWTETEKSHGILYVKLQSWNYFFDYIREEMLNYRDYIWRGQRCSDWLLEPTLDRVLKKKSKREQKSIVNEHLDNFKFATRGRRGTTPHRINHDNDWWALGQHYGLFTPLLDWTSSPFLASYFAFIDIGLDQTRNRAIYALSTELTNGNNAANPPDLEFLRPLSDENYRLVSQGGLFTRGPVGVDIEHWVKNYYPAENDDYIFLKITVPNSNRKNVLKSLNRMNINHLSLFPDLFGSSKFCNMDLEISNY